MGDALPDLDAMIIRLAGGERAALEPILRLLWPVVRNFCVSFLKGEA